MYKFITKSNKYKSKVMSLEKYILLYYLKNKCNLLTNL